jgi:apolipoprotein D and lipocalin family protein
MFGFFKKNHKNLLLPAFLGLMLISTGRAMDTEKNQTTIDTVNLEKYAGTWHEFARLPNSFQKKCAHSTTASYALLLDGKISVLNRCVKANGQAAVAKGIARIPDEKFPGRLQVSFVSLLGMRLFWGDYWIIGLADDYRYAVVGSPSKKYLWVLSRETSLASKDWLDIQNLLLEYAYAADQLIISGKIKD